MCVGFGSFAPAHTTLAKVERKAQKLFQSDRIRFAIRMRLLLRRWERVMVGSFLVERENDYGFGGVRSDDSCMFFAIARAGAKAKIRTESETALRF